MATIPGKRSPVGRVIDAVWASLVYLYRPGETRQLRHERAREIRSTAQVMAGLATFITALWIAWSWAFFDLGPALLRPLTFIHLAAIAGFGAIAIWPGARNFLDRPVLPVVLLYAVAMGFVLAVNVVIWREQGAGGEPLHTIATFLPILIIVGLAIFPLTTVESLLMLGGVLLMVTFWNVGDVVPAADTFDVGALLMLMLVATAQTATSLHRLVRLNELVEQRVHDPMTGGFAHNSGEELLAIEFMSSVRSGTPMSLAFVDIDAYGQVRQLGGDEAADELLKKAGQRMTTRLRGQDTLVRWDGDKFLAILPNTDAEGAAIWASRFGDGGVTTRPDGQPMTLSVGVAERLHDKLDNWILAIETAQTRMMMVKREGGDGYVNCLSEIYHYGASAPPPPATDATPGESP